MNETIVDIGAVCFGLVVGYIAYRTLARSESTGVSDLAAVIAAIGGGTVTTIYDPNASAELFAWYAFGLALGFVVYGVLYYRLNGKEGLSGVLGGDSEPSPTPIVK